MKYRPLPVPAAASVERALFLLGRDNVDEDQAARDLAEQGIGDELARRLLLWLPEAFAMTLVAHSELGVVLPCSFTARDGNGHLHALPLECEPVFAEGLRRARLMYQQGPRAAFKAICERSSSLNAIDNALKAGADLQGATLSGPELLDIPAETYLQA
ncbi:hypothetical protein [uncultured Stenotrophomonas sp.]|uniref:hypothetical protein n=1 Tax=uncultured Stenotrophomonas sp. TaxID=165438 RepID=UPI0025FB985C|nr:hypothetical protein [uncultured Stenotrophomonas sp.]